MKREIKLMNVAVLEANYRKIIDSYDGCDYVEYLEGKWFLAMNQLDKDNEESIDSYLSWLTIQCYDKLDR